MRRLLGVLLLAGCQAPAPAGGSFVLDRPGVYEVGPGSDVVGGYASLAEAELAEAVPDLATGGLVTDEAGQPLADALVSTSDGRVSRTNAQGRYAMEGEPPVDGGFVAYHAGLVAEAVVGAPGPAPDFRLPAGHPLARAALALPAIPPPTGLALNGALHFGLVPGATSYVVALEGPKGLLWEAMTPVGDLALSYQGDLPEGAYRLAVKALGGDQPSANAIEFRFTP